MGAKLDLTGATFGRLTVIHKAGRKDARVMWACRCECGAETMTPTILLRNGHSRSCGCLKREMAADRKRTHGMKGTREYRLWQNMRWRCESQNSDDWADYGGRGIKVCERWGKFENFFADVGRVPDGMSLDRINVDGNYEPGNVRWATPRQQAQNKRTNVLITWRGETHCLVEWERRLGVREGLLQARITHLHWSIDRAFTTPARKLTKPELKCA